MRTVLAAILLAIPPWAHAQQPAGSAPPPPPAPEPFGLIDNSFLVEESFNQGAGTFQNILTAVRANGVWSAAFIQEWPLVSDNHQFSYLLPWSFGSGPSVFGDVLINYRFQALREASGRPAFAPRVSAVLPTASGSVTTDAWGIQINLPFSKRTGDVYWHWNGGLTWLPAADLGARSVSLESPFLAGSAVVRIAPMFQAMLEVVANFDEEQASAGTGRTRALTASPGVRGGWDIGRQGDQVVVGFAIPTTWSSDARREVAALIYASYELPFKR